MIKFIIFNAILCAVGSVCYLNEQVGAAGLLWGISITNLFWAMEMNE